MSDRKNGGEPAYLMRAGGRPVPGCLICRVVHRMRGGKAPLSGEQPSCFGSMPLTSLIMPGDGESRTACATRDLASDPAKRFWEGRGSLRGKGRPFSKKGPLPPHPYYSCSSASMSASSWRMPSRRAAAVSLRPAWSSLPMMPSSVSASQGKRLSARASACVTEERPLRA